MIESDALPFAIVALAFAGFVKGATGFGLPLLSVPALANILGPKMAVIIMSIPTFVVGMSMAAQTRSWEVRGQMGPLGWLIVTLLGGTIVGANLLASLDTSAIAIVVGLTSIAFTLVAWKGQGLDLRSQANRFAPAFGTVAGVLNGATNISGPLIAIYLRCLQLDKRTFVAAINLLFTLMGVVQLASYFQLGLYTTQSVMLSLGACVPIFVGVFVGMRANFLMGQQLFDRAVLIVILVSGLRLLASVLFR